MPGGIDDSAARIIGPFRVVRCLGAGSTGEVFLAERIESFPQRVAIKLLPAGAHEANVLVALDHPHIVKLIDRDVLSDGQRYLVMEYVEGEPIDIHCSGRQSTLNERVRLLIKVMDALSHAHGHLVIHADLKPSNILVTADGEPKLLDFGVAQWLGRGPSGFTPAFASPEQKAGARLTAASDVYSLGLLASGLLPGERGRDLDSVLATATAAAAAERYPSIDTFKADLQRYLDGRDVSVRASSPMAGAVRWVGRHRLLSATTLVISLTLAFAVGGVIRHAAQAARQRTLAEAQLHELVSLTGTLEGDLYESVRPLPRSAEARRILLQGASQTLAILSDRDNEDSILALELARQYAKLARLQLAEVNQTPDDPAAAKRAALRAVDDGMRQLRSIGQGDSQYSAAQRELSAMRRWRASI